MKTIRCWRDLEPFGIEALTGEACGLMYRILFDVSEAGRRVLSKCFGIPNLTLAEAWNSKSSIGEHVGSIMLSQEMLVPIGVFALLENGCKEVWWVGDQLIGFESADERHKPEMERIVKDRKRIFRYTGTAGDRNQHVMSGRIE